MLLTKANKQPKIIEIVGLAVVLLLMAASVFIPLTSMAKASPPKIGHESGPGVIGDLGGFDFGDQLMDFSQFGDYAQFESGPDGVIAPIEFDYAGFFRVFDDPSLFEQADGNYGDLAGVLGSFDDYAGEFSDFKDFGGSFDDLGGFFNRSDEALAAYGLVRDLTPEDLEFLGAGLAYDVLEGLDYFGFHLSGADIVGQLLESTRETREVRDLSFMTAKQWAGAIGTLRRAEIVGLDRDLLVTALDAMQGRDFLLLPPESAAALFETTVLKFDENAGQSLADNLAVYGDDALDMLSATDHGYFFTIGNVIDEIFGSINFTTLNLETSSASSDDIGVMMAAMGARLRDQGSQNLSAAIAHMGVGDFGGWTSEVAFDVIGALGLEQVLELEQLEGIVGSFEPENVGLLGQNLDEVIIALDFDTHSDLLSRFSEGALNTLTTLELGGFESLADLLGLANSAGAEGIVRVTSDRLDAVLTRIGSNRFHLLDFDTFAALTAVIPADILGGHSDEFRGAILSNLGVNLFGSGALDFGEMPAAVTTFDLLADSVGTELENGEKTYFSLLVDGSSSLDEGALVLFEGQLFGDR